MKKQLAIVTLLTVLYSTTSWCQKTGITGTVKNSITGENIPAVSIILKGNNNGTFTNENGVFKMTVQGFPLTLVVSSIGYETVEIPLNSPSEKGDRKPRSRSRSGTGCSCLCYQGSNANPGIPG